MRKKIWVLFISLSLVAFLSVSVSAYTVPLDFKFKYSNAEVVIQDPPIINWDPNGNSVQLFPANDNVEDNWGIFKITSIQDRAAGDSEVWSEGDGNQYLTGIFWGLGQVTTSAIDSNLDSIPDTFNGFLGQSTTTAEGFAVPDLDGDGFSDAGLSVYLSDTDPYDTAFQAGPNARTAANLFPGITDGVLQANFLFEPGIIADPNILVTNNASSYTEPLTGKGEGYLDVLPGSGLLADLIVQDAFNVNGFLRDVFAQFNFRNHPDTGLPDYGWNVNSEDPIIGSAVPEPGTMFLLGVGLIGIAAIRRRKNHS